MVVATQGQVIVFSIATIAFGLAAMRTVRTVRQHSMKKSGFLLLLAVASALWATGNSLILAQRPMVADPILICARVLFVVAALHAVAVITRLRAQHRD